MADTCDPSAYLDRQRELQDDLARPGIEMVPQAVDRISGELQEKVAHYTAELWATVRSTMSGSVADDDPAVEVLQQRFDSLIEVVARSLNLASVVAHEFAADQRFKAED